ncbi:hypothetical protein E5E49_03445 [Helicobacter pylori]|nr:hypothetical protein E5E49_03445 [Helicobacter pylori]
MECYDEELKKKSFKNLTISIDHIDGTMNCKVRLDKLEKLNQFKPNTCKVLSNARCLSEGVDVLASDSIVFFDGKSTMVDIIQAVGRVMRKAKHKKRGYIILYYYDDFGNRHDAISGYALNLFRKHYEDNSIAEEEIFYYIYAILHHKGYLEKYKNSLTKEDPRIALSEDFKELSALGKELAKLHLNYESEELHASVEYKTLMNAEEKGYYDVETMKKIGDRINYNKTISLSLKSPKKPLIMW